MHRTRTRSLAAALAIGSAAVVGAPVSGAGALPDPAVRHLTWQYHQSAAVLGAPLCTGGRCVVPFTLTGTSSGGSQGTFVSSGTGSPLPDGSLFANSTLIFVGTIADCGTGTVVMTSTGFNRAGATSGTIVLVEGSGTGGLAEISGQGTVVDGQVAPDGTSSGSIEMTLRCRRP